MNKYIAYFEYVSGNTKIKGSEEFEAQRDDIARTIVSGYRFRGWELVELHKILSVEDMDT